MRTKSAKARLALFLVLLGLTSILLLDPVDPELSTDVVFDDPIERRLEQEASSEPQSHLLLRISHDEGGSLTGDLARVQDLLEIERQMRGLAEGEGVWTSEEVRIAAIETPFYHWSSAFSSRNRSLENATRWADVLQPEIDGGWCAAGATTEEGKAFEATLLMLPREANPGVACPAMPGASVSQPPSANEILWLLQLESDQDHTDWSQLSMWADRTSDTTAYTFEAVGVNLLMDEARTIAEEDLRNLLLPSAVLLLLVLIVGLRDLVAAAATLGGVSLAIGSGLGILSVFGHNLSVIDGIAMPIVMGVAVDGAFWYGRSSRDRDEVRRMLLVAMLTTVAAVSLAFASPIRAQRSLALVIVIGIFLDWLITRFLLEDIYLRRRDERAGPSRPFAPPESVRKSFWPVALTMLAAMAIIAPSGVEVLDIEQFLPEDSPFLAELEDLGPRYLMMSTADMWLVVDASGDDPEDLQKVLELQRQLGNHPSVVALNTGVHVRPLVFGIPATSDPNATINQIGASGAESLLMSDPVLRRDGVTSGVAIAIMIDGQDSNAALALAEDLDALMERMDLEGEIGGDLLIGASLSRDFEEARFGQIIGAGLVILLVSYYLLRSPRASVRIAIGAVAIGIAVDGFASLSGGRGVDTAPAVLLGMGFAADYLSHASAAHAPTWRDTSARWLAAISSASVFVLLALATFPLASSTGRLLTLSILLSAILATAMSLLANENPLPKIRPDDSVAEE